MAGIIKYNPKLKQLARALRKISTLGEVLLWNQLKSKRILSYDFHRQKPIDNYIVDFFSPDLMLAIEIDGNTHGFDERIKNDKIRQERLEKLGIKFLRFSENDVRNYPGEVVEAIKYWIEENSR
jgi:very-short-patch-repair endonuclease